MNRKKRIVVIAATVVLLVITIVVLNSYDTQFYSDYVFIGKIHTPLELEEVSYVTHLSMEVEGTYIFADEEELAMWDDFVKWLNNTTFIKVRSTEGTSYTGEGIFFKFKGIEKELWIVVGRSGKSIGLGDYVWKPIGDIVLPVDEAYLLEMKAEQQTNE